MSRTVLVLCLLALPLFAEEKEDATRYHEAYVLEVIDGKVADAAKAYLALLGDSKVATTIRLQAEFRFAVCAALLGRPDEARARLAALRGKEGMTAALRAQIEEYRRALEGVAPGSALEKRMEDLVFQLGRAKPVLQSTPSVYRDFQILGDKARPYLHRLLSHSDATVRQHAFRLLLRMREPDMIEHWDASYNACHYDLRVYLARFPDSVPAFEKRLLAAKAWSALQLIGGYKLDWSADLIAALPGAGQPKMAADFARYQLDDSEVLALVDRWLKTPREPIGRETAQVYLRWIAYLDGASLVEKKEPLLVASRFPAVVAGAGETRLDDNNEIKGLQVYAAAMPADVVLEALAAWVARAAEIDAAPGLHGLHPFAGRLGRVLAHALDKKELSAGQRAKYGPLLREWIEEIVKRFGKKLMYQRFGRHLGAAYAGKPAELEATVRVLFQGSLKGLEPMLWDLADFEDPAGVKWFGVLLRNAGASGRSALMDQFSRFMQKSTLSEAVCRALAQEAPDWLVLADAGAPTLARSIVKCAHKLDPALVRRSLRKCVAAALKLRGVRRTGVLGAWFSTLVSYGVARAETRELHVKSVLPLSGEIVAQFEGTDRTWLVERLADHLQQNLQLDEMRPVLARIVLRNVEYLRTNKYAALLTYDAETFPPEEWFHRIQLPATLPWQNVEATADRLIEHPENARPKLVSHLLARRPGLLDALLAKAEADTIARLSPIVKPENVSGPGAERGMLALLESEPVDLGALGRLAQVVAQIRASDKLIPVARRLLRATEPKHIKLGIALARSLAKSSLKVDLLALLDSPDANIRNAAKEAFEAIDEWDEFRAARGK